MHFTMQRLQFWCSPETAPYIRVCTVSPWDYPELSNSYRPASVDESHRTPVDSFFHSIPLFTNLRDFRAYAIVLNKIATQNLRRLPHLTRLDVRMCAADEGVDSVGYPPLNLSAYKNFNPPSSAWDPWHPLLHPDALRHLEMTCTQKLLSQLEKWHPFLHVKTLLLSANAATVSRTFQVLAKFPATEVLTFTEITDLIEGHLDVSHVLPNIREYTGPPSLLDVVLPISTLRRISLHQSTPTTVLTRCRHSPHITSLCVNLTGFNIGILEDLCELFPSLTEFQVVLRFSPPGLITTDEHEHDRIWKAEPFFEKLISRSSLPHSVRKLAIHWKWADHSRDTNHVPDLPKLKDALLSCHPGMKCIWLEGTQFLYFWRKGYTEAQYRYYKDEFSPDTDWQFLWDTTPMD
ncbi:hypothetical protein DFH07DRAFT_852594 [Mycena maculata]|uniref:Uncharacterized protein n=1 Tax=Mycena maculata TaxID=230809 RepID=A0AAD7MPC3_9AGAR|nr:hypothetical protein DFH07DRAFT_852594 [Mycena maculata]